MSRSTRLIDVLRNILHYVAGVTNPRGSTTSVLMCSHRLFVDDTSVHTTTTQLCKNPSLQGRKQDESDSFSAPTPPPTPPSWVCSVDGDFASGFGEAKQVTPCAGPKSILKETRSKPSASYFEKRSNGNRVTWAYEVDIVEKWRHQLEHVRRSRKMQDKDMARRSWSHMNNSGRTLTRAARFSVLGDMDDMVNKRGKASSRRRNVRGMRGIVGENLQRSALTAGVDRLITRRMTSAGPSGVRRNILAPGPDACRDSWLAEELFQRAQEESVADVLYKRAHLNGSDWDGVCAGGSSNSEDAGHILLAPRPDVAQGSWLENELFSRARSESEMSTLFRRAYLNGRL